MGTAEHREPCDSRGSCTVLGAPGGEIPPGDSTRTVIEAVAAHGPVCSKQRTLSCRRLKGRDGHQPVVAAGAGRSHPHREGQLAVPGRVEGQPGRIRRPPKAQLFASDVMMLLSQLVISPEVIVIVLPRLAQLVRQSPSTTAPPLLTFTFAVTTLSWPLIANPP
jgi:hypothetical protein